MTGAKKSAFAGQGKGWRKGVKGIGVKRKTPDGEEPVRRKKRRVKVRENADGQAQAKAGEQVADAGGTRPGTVEAHLTSRTGSEEAAFQQGKHTVNKPFRMCMEETN